VKSRGEQAEDIFIRSQKPGLKKGGSVTSKFDKKKGPPHRSRGGGKKQELQAFSVVGGKANTGKTLLKKAGIGGEE